MRRVPALLKTVLALQIALLCGATGAAAATIFVVTRGVGENAITYFDYAAGSGEDNRLSVGYEEGRVVFEDAGAEIEHHSACTGDAHRVSCGGFAGGRLGPVDVYLVDGADELTVLPSTSDLTAWGGDARDVMRVTGSDGSFAGRFAGEDGDDVLSTTRAALLDGGRGEDSLDGGPAGATLHAGPGRDVMSGGAGDDTLAPGLDEDPDVVDGGEGRDFVSYADVGRPPRPLTIDMSVPSAAAGDELRSIEAALGSHSADVLRGGDAADELNGMGGADTIRGGAGDDVLDGGFDADGALVPDNVAGGPGDDRVSGGPGRDTLSGGSGDDWMDPWKLPWKRDDDDSREYVSCGSGQDTLFLPDPLRPVAAAFRAVPADCELLEVEGSRLGRIRARPKLSGGEARWSLLCLQATSKGTCPATFELRAAGAPLGRGSAQPRPGRRATLRVRLNEAGRRLARRGGRVVVTMRVKGVFGAHGPGHSRRFTVTLPGLTG